MNTLFLYWGKKGGGAKYSLEIARELSKRDDINLHLSLSNYCELLEEFKKLQLPSFFVDTYSSIPGFLKTWFFRKKKLQHELYNYFRENQIESVIIGMDFFWGSVINEAAKLAGVKSVLVVHEPEPHPNEPFFMTQFKSIGLKKGITSADHIVTLTEHVKSVVGNQYQIDDERISVIPHGIFEYYQADSPKTFPQNNEPVRFLYFGRIEYYKGLDILLKSFSILENRTDNVKLEVWGSGSLDEYGDVISEIENIHIENRWVDEDEITRVFKNCHVCVLPYRQASQSGIAGIAGSAGMPIAACPATGLKEQLKDYGALISVDFTSESLAECMFQLVDDPILYQTLSEKSLKYADSLSWEKIAEKFARLIQSNKL